MQNRRVIGKLSCAFLEKTIGPCKITGMVGGVSENVGDVSQNAGDLGIIRRELSRFLREFERLLVVL